MGIKQNLMTEKKIPEEFKDLAKDFAEKGFITTSSDNLINWARTGSSTKGYHGQTPGLGMSGYKRQQCAGKNRPVDFRCLWVRAWRQVCNRSTNGQS